MSDAFRDRVVEFVRVPASSLRANAKNWRTHPKQQRAALSAMLAEVGFAGAVLARRDAGGGGLVLIDGHLRADVAKDQLVPVLVLDVTAEEADKLLATLDPIGAMAKMDAEKLAELLNGMTAGSAGVEELLTRLSKSAAEGVALLQTKEDTPVAPLPTAVTRRGDVWLMESENGRGHRLLCGDSTTEADVTRVMDGNKAALIATDPPYLVNYTGNNLGNGKDWSGIYHEVDTKDAESFFGALFERVLEVAAPRAAIYCWHAHKLARRIEEAWDRLGIVNHQQIIWVKPTRVFGRVFWQFRHEPCLMGWIRGEQPLHDGDQSIDSVWVIDWEGKPRVVGNEHPTQKPLEIFARPMRKHTRPGAICFEPFSGSGSQLVAAEQMGRRCFAIELEPVFVDVAVRRWQNLTGKPARLDADGRTWAEIAADRGVPTE